MDGIQEEPPGSRGGVAVLSERAVRELHGADRQTGFGEGEIDPHQRGARLLGRWILREVQHRRCNVPLRKENQKYIARVAK